MNVERSVWILDLFIERELKLFVNVLGGGVRKR